MSQGIVWGGQVLYSPVNIEFWLYFTMQNKQYKNRVNIVTPHPIKDKGKKHSIKSFIKNVSKEIQIYHFMIK